MIDWYGKVKELGYENLPMALKSLYNDSDNTLWDIAYIFGCCDTTILKLMRKFGIKRRKAGHRIPWMNLARGLGYVNPKEMLFDLRYNQGLSLSEISVKLYGVGRTTIFSRLKEEKIHAKMQDKKRGGLSRKFREFSKLFVKGR